jgi:Xaa-Pro aminopeptidase
MCPIHTNLIDKKMLTVDEIRYLNAYHAEVWQKLHRLLPAREAGWLKRATRPI